MTDKEKLVNLLCEFGIKLSHEDAGTTVACYVVDGKIESYFGFSIFYIFDDNGKFIKMEIG